MKDKVIVPVLVVGIVVVIVGGFWMLFALGLRWAWNTVFPAVFDWPALTFWQAFALVVLLSIVGGFFRSSTSSSNTGRR